MNTYRVLSMGGRLLAQSQDHHQAYRMAHRIADERGCYVELHTPAGHTYFIYPAAR